MNRPEETFINFILDVNNCLLKFYLYQQINTVGPWHLRFCFLWTRLFTVHKLTSFYICSPVLYVFTVFSHFHSTGIFVFFSDLLLHSWFCDLCIRVFSWFFHSLAWMYSHFFMRFLFFPDESQTAENLSLFFPLK